MASIQGELGVEGLEVNRTQNEQGRRRRNTDTCLGHRTLVRRRLR